VRVSLTDPNEATQNTIDWEIENKEKKKIIKSSGSCTQVWVVHMTTLRPFRINSSNEELPDNSFVSTVRENVCAVMDERKF